MPLIIDTNVIQNINGPVSIYFLRQKEDFGPLLNNNYFIFLGDEHNMNNFKPCFNTPECTELQTDFIKILNNFASTTRTDFYIEYFLSLNKDDLSERNYPILKRTIEGTQNVYKDLRNDPRLRELDETTAVQIIEDYEKKIKRDTYRKRTGRSNMTELNNLYYSCFYKPFKDEFCPYKNIYWHYGDARKAQGYTKDNINSVQYITEIIGNFSNFILKHFGDDKEVIDNNTLLELGEILYMDNINDELFHIIELSITNIPQFVELLLDKLLFKKQMSKMNEYTRSIFTTSSFIQLGELYRQIFTADFTNFLTIISLIQTYYHLYRDREGVFTDSDEEIISSIIEKLNRFSFPKDVLMDYAYIPMCIGNLAMDIYFILRTYKQDSEVNKKLVLNYFGSLHSQQLTRYFTEIVQTHTIDFAHKNEPDTIRRINIVPTINLNEIMEHEPIPMNQDAGKKRRTRRQRRKNSKKNKRKNTKKNKRRCK
jgi:hypothetical protein